MLVGFGPLHCQFPLDSGQNFAVLIQYRVPGVASFFKFWVSLILSTKKQETKIRQSVYNKTTISFMRDMGLHFLHILSEYFHKHYKHHVSGKWCDYQFDVCLCVCVCARMSNIPLGLSWGCGWVGGQVYSWPAEGNGPSVVLCSGDPLYPEETSPNIPETHPRIKSFTHRLMEGFICVYIYSTHQKFGRHVAACFPNQTCAGRYFFLLYSFKCCTIRETTSNSCKYIWSSSNTGKNYCVLLKGLQSMLALKKQLNTNHKAMK